MLIYNLEAQIIPQLQLFPIFMYPPPTVILRGRSNARERPRCILPSLSPRPEI